MSARLTCALRSSGAAQILCSIARRLLAARIPGSTLPVIDKRS
jgi:hypothetical protein